MQSSYSRGRTSRELIARNHVFQARPSALTAYALVSVKAQGGVCRRVHHFWLLGELKRKGRVQNPQLCARGPVCVCVQSLCMCPTLCDPMDCSPPGSSVLGILQARILGVGCHALFQGFFPTQGSSPRLLCLLHCRWVPHH